MNAHIFREYDIRGLVDRDLTEEQPRIDDLKARLDALDVVGDQPLQAPDVLDFQLPERRSHHTLPWPLSCEAHMRR